MEGWVKLHRKFKNWEWSNSPNHVAVFIHLILDAQFSESKYRGKDVKVGQIITGRRRISTQTGVSEQSVRTILNDLKATHELTIKNMAKYSIITITNWDDYQQSTSISTSESTINQPSTNQQLTTYKNVKNVKNEISNTKPLAFDAAKPIIDYLNKRISSSYKHYTKSTVSKINARLLEGYTVKDFHTVIDSKADQWQGSDMAKYLRPETLFGNKFESYLQEVYLPLNKNSWVDLFVTEADPGESILKLLVEK